MLLKWLDCMVTSAFVTNARLATCTLSAVLGAIDTHVSPCVCWAPTAAAGAHSARDGGRVSRLDHLEQQALA